MSPRRYDTHVSLVRRAALPILLVLALLTAGCLGAAPSEPTPGAGATDAGDDTRLVTDAVGTTAIEGTPERVVVLEYTYVENVLALGVQPVGVADIEGYEKWVNISVELSDDATDVGTRQEPSLEKIASLDPDLIIGVKFRHEPIHDKLQAIAPTLLFEPYPPEGGISADQEMRRTFLSIAEALDRTEKGQQVLADMDASLEDARQRLNASDALGREVLLVQAFTYEGTPYMRVFTNNSMAMGFLQTVGLENAWNASFQRYGFSTVDIEALAPHDDADFLYVAHEGDDPFQGRWSDNPAWRNYTFVQEDRVYPLGGDTWLFGGPLSTELFVDKVVDHLTG